MLDFPQVTCYSEEKYLQESIFNYPGTIHHKRYPQMPLKVPTLGHLLFVYPVY